MKYHSVPDNQPQASKRKAEQRNVNSSQQNDHAPAICRNTLFVLFLRFNSLAERLNRAFSNFIFVFPNLASNMRAKIKHLKNECNHNAEYDRANDRQNRSDDEVGFVRYDPISHAMLPRCNNGFTRRHLTYFQQLYVSSATSRRSLRPQQDSPVPLSRISLIQEEIMATSNNPLAPNPETDIDSAEIHNIPLKDIETGEIEEVDPEEEELDENIESEG